MADDPRRHELSKQLEGLSPLEVDGVPFGLRLMDVVYPESYQTQAVRVFVEAVHGSERHTGQLHVSDERYRSADFVDDIVSMMDAIVRGDLPPGAAELI